MAKRKSEKPELVLGIDIGKDNLAVAMKGLDGVVQDHEFTNDDGGHKLLITMCTKGGRQARVALEASGPYWLDLALALTTAKVRVMVVNPKAARRFAEAAMTRGKNDRVDARMLLEFAVRMEYTAWTPPSAARLALRMYARQIAALTQDLTAWQNRLSNAEATAQTPAVVLDDIKLGLEQLKVRIAALVAAALAHIKAHDELAKPYELAVSVRGIADKSAIAILGELLVLPPDMTAPQWVAYAGLDPRPFKSGTSVDKKPRISRIGNARLRHALFMPALTMARWEPAAARFYEELLARGKKPMVAVVAIMRKLLHALWGMLRTNTLFDGERFRSSKGKAAAAA